MVSARSSTAPDRAGNFMCDLCIADRRTYKVRPAYCPLRRLVAVSTKAVRRPDLQVRLKPQNARKRKKNFSLLQLFETDLRL
jgi:hypothetical protein